jgi:hypothetical protein
VGLSGLREGREGVRVVMRVEGLVNDDVYGVTLAAAR